LTFGTAVASSSALLDHKGKGWLPPVRSLQISVEICCLGEVITGSPATFNPGSGYTIEERVPAEPNTKLIVEDQRQSIAGSAAAGASLGASDHWGAVLAAFRHP
jgi:hypothetical protein